MSIGLVLFETITLAINKWSCPLTLIAKKYTRNLLKTAKIILISIFLNGLQGIIR